MKFYWFNLGWTHGAVSQWMTFVMDEDGNILWQDYDMDNLDKWGQPKEIWVKEVPNVSFDYKDEYIDLIENHAERVQKAVLESYEFEETVPVSRHLEAWCYNCFDSEGDNFIAP